MKPAPKYRIQLRPQMRTITPEVVREEGYRILTNPVSLARETAVFRDIESTMESCGAVWIDHGNGTYSAARKRRDLIEANLSPLERKLREKGLTQSAKPKRRTREPLAVEALVSADARRDGKGGKL